MNIIAIIPARMGSSRYPGKPLAPIHGIPMVGHVAFRTAMSKILSDSYVATCDTCIEDYCKSVGLKCVMRPCSKLRLPRERGWTSLSWFRETNLWFCPR